MSYVVTLISYVATLMSYVATLMSYVATLMSYVAVATLMSYVTVPLLRKNCLYLFNYDGLLCYKKQVILVGQRRAFLQQWHQYQLFVSFVTILSLECINIHCFVSLVIIVSFVCIPAGQLEF